MTFFLVGLGLVGLALYLRLRIFIGTRPGGVDTWYYLASADALRRQKRLPIKLSLYLLHEPYESYPAVFPIFLALLPQDFLRKYFWLISPIIDCVHLLLLYLLSFRLTDSVFAAGLILVGVAGARLVSWIGREAALRLALAGMILGGLFLAAPAPAVTLVGTLSVGLGAALLIQLVPAGLSALHPRAPAGAIGEANGLASAASILPCGSAWRPSCHGSPETALIPPTLTFAALGFHHAASNCNHSASR